MKRPFILIATYLLFSCELIVDVDVPFERKEVTVNSMFTPDSLWTVQLNYNRHILDNEPFEEINNATVIIYDGGQPIDTLINIGSGRYRSDTGKPEFDKLYSIEVIAPGYNTLQSVSYMPRPAPITGIEMYESGLDYTTVIKVKLKDDPAEENFYELFVENENEWYNLLENKVETFYHRFQLTSDDPAIQNDNGSFGNNIVFKDALFNGKEVELAFKIAASGFMNTSSFTITLRTLSEDGYNYRRTASLHDMTSGDPFAQPINVYNNIKNGFGIFAGYSASIYSKGKPKPVITGINPPSGKPGDHIFITGENFPVPPNDFVRVIFQQGLIGQIVYATATQIEVIVPQTAVSGKIVVQGSRVVVSKDDFIIDD